MPERKAKYILEAEDRTRLALKKAERNFASFGKSIARSMGPLIGIGAGAGMASFVGSTLDAADALAKTADKLGLTTDQLQEYNFAAERSGMTTEQLASNMTAFVKRVGEARQGTGPLVSFLKKYDEQLLKNIKNSKDQEEALNLVAEAIKNAETATDKAAIANAAFSRSGIAMVNMLANGRIGLDELRQAARDAGVVLDEKLLRNAEKINDQWETLTDTIGTKFKKAVLEAANAVTSLNWVLNNQRTDADDRYLQAQRDLIELTEKRKALIAKFSAGEGDSSKIGREIDELALKISTLRWELKVTGEEKDNLFDESGSGGFVGPPAPDLNKPDKTTTTARTKVDPFGAAIENMQRQLAMLDATTQHEKTLWEIQSGRYQSLSENQQKALLDAATALDMKKQEMDVAGEAEQYAESQEQAAQAWRELLNPMEEVDQQLTELDRLLEEGRISWDTYAEAVFHTADALDDVGEKADETTNELSVFADQAARNMQDAFADFLFDPFDDGLEGMIKGFADTLRRMAADAIAAKIFDKIFQTGGASTAGGGGDNDYGSLFAIFASLFHDGGIVGQGGTPRAVSPLVFANAPRYHSGGIAGLKPNEVPAILEKGELVTPRDQVASAGQSGISSVKVVMVDDRGDVPNQMTSPPGEKAILQVIRRNATAVKQVLT